MKLSATFSGPHSFVQAACSRIIPWCWVPISVPIGRRTNHLTLNQRVVGSSPTAPTNNFIGLAQPRAVKESPSKHIVSTLIQKGTVRRDCTASWAHVGIMSRREKRAAKGCLSHSPNLLRCRSRFVPSASSITSPRFRPLGAICLRGGAMSSALRLRRALTPA